MAVLYDSISEQLASEQIVSRDFAYESIQEEQRPLIKIDGKPVCMSFKVHIPQHEEVVVMPESDNTRVLPVKMVPRLCSSVSNSIKQPSTPLTKRKWTSGVRFRDERIGDTEDLIKARRLF